MSENKVALEAMRVGLHHAQVVLAPLEHLHLIHLGHHQILDLFGQEANRTHDEIAHLKLSAWREVSLPCDSQACAPFPGHTQPSCQLGTICSNFFVWISLPFGRCLSRRSMATTMYLYPQQSMHSVNCPVSFFKLFSIVSTFDKFVPKREILC